MSRFAKKMLCVGLTAAMLLQLTACSGNVASDTSKTDGQAQSETEQTTEEQTENSTEEQTEAETKQQEAYEFVPGDSALVR